MKDACFSTPSASNSGCIRIKRREIRHLCLAGTGTRAVDLGATGLSLGKRRALAEEVMGVGDRGLGHAAKGFAGLVLLGSFLGVSGNVEGDEEHQVGGEDTNAREGSELLARALAGIGPRRLVGGNEVSVGGEVDESCAKLVDEAGSVEWKRTYRGQ